MVDRSYNNMSDDKDRGATRRLSSDRRGDHRRENHRRIANEVVESDKRSKLDQRKAYQRESLRLSGSERRV